MKTLLLLCLVTVAIGCSKNAQKADAHPGDAGDSDNHSKTDDDPSQTDPETNSLNACLALDVFEGGLNIQVNPNAAAPGKEVTITSTDPFPDQNENAYVILSGLRIKPKHWDASEITFSVPKNSVSGPLYVRFSDTDRSSKMPAFRVIRTLSNESRPKGLKLTDSGINGVSILVETDGDYLYSVTGTNALTTYQLCQEKAGEKTCPPPSNVTNYDEGYRVKSRIYFPQRLSHIKLLGGCLFTVGSHGLKVYSTKTLQSQTKPEPIAQVAGAFYSVAGKEEDGDLQIALSEHLPKTNQTPLHAYMYSFDGETGEMNRTWTYQVPLCLSCSRERLFGIAIDSLYDKVYVGRASYNLLGLVAGKIDELVYTNADHQTPPLLNHTEPYGNLQIPWVLEATHAQGETSGRLWSSILYMGPGISQSFKVYETSNSNPLALRDTIKMVNDVAHAERFSILDDEITVGMNNSIQSPDVGFVNTVDTCGCDTPPCSCWIADKGDTADGYDWPHDVTISSNFPGNEEYDGRVIVSDEWGGILTYPYKNGDAPTFTEAGFEAAPSICTNRFLAQCNEWGPTLQKFDPSYHIPTGGDGAPGIHLSEDRVYIGARGGGLWSADRRDISNGAKWKFVPWNWEYTQGLEADPQPHAMTGMRSRRYSLSGPTFVVGRGHNKDVNWGSRVMAILYRENETGIIEELATSEEVLGNYGLSFYTLNGQIIWPEPDLVYITTYHMGIHAYVVNPKEGEESIALHTDSPFNQLGFIERPVGDFAVTTKWHKVSGQTIAGHMLVGFLGGTGLHRYDVSYPGTDPTAPDEFDGMPPNRDNPDLHIVFDNKIDLGCLAGKDVDRLDATDEGIIAAVTSDGLALFSMDAFDGTQPTWNEIKVNLNSWGWDRQHPNRFGPKVDDNGFVNLGFDTGDPDYLYVLNNGLWRLRISRDSDTGKVSAQPVAYYPGITKFGAHHDYPGEGMRIWDDPDLPTLHQPLAVAGDVGQGEGAIYVTTWPGTVQRLELTEEN